MLGSVRSIARTAGLRRVHVVAARMRVERTTLALLHRGGSAERPRILSYHSVGTPSMGVNDITPERFRHQLEAVITGRVDGRHDMARDAVLSWSDLEGLVATGVRIGSHSMTHPDFGHLDPATAVAELAGSRRLLKERLGIDVAEFAIPYGQSRNWTPGAADAATAAGYEHVYAQSVATRPPGTISRTFISGMDGDREFEAALRGAFDNWEEWY